MTIPSTNRLAEHILHLSVCRQIAERISADCDDMRQRFPEHKAAIDDVELQIVSALKKGDLDQAKLLIEKASAEAIFGGEGQP